MKKRIVPQKKEQANFYLLPEIKLMVREMAGKKSDSEIVDKAIRDYYSRFNKKIEDEIEKDKLDVVEMLREQISNHNNLLKEFNDFKELLTSEMQIVKETSETNKTEVGKRVKASQLAPALFTLKTEGKLKGFAYGI